MNRLRTASLGAALAAASLTLSAASPLPLRDQFVAAGIDANLGGGTTVLDASSQAFTRMAPNAPADQTRLFLFGSRVFTTQWAEHPGPVQSFDGLGPTFNRASCDGCHVLAGRGQPPAKPGNPMDSMLVRLSG